MFLLVALAAVATPTPAADEFPLIDRVPIGIPNVKDCSELSLVFGVSGRIHCAATTVEHIGSGDDHHLIRHGNAEGNIEKRVIRSFSGSHVAIDKIERHTGKKKWADAGRLVTAYLGSRWTCGVEIVDGSASVWLTYYDSDSTDASVGYDLAGGGLVRLRTRRNDD